jgi:hypothetical protein
MRRDLVSVAFEFLDPCALALRARLKQIERRMRTPRPQQLEESRLHARRWAVVVGQHERSATRYLKTSPQHRAKDAVTDRDTARPQRRRDRDSRCHAAERESGVVEECIQWFSSLSSFAISGILLQHDAARVRTVVSYRNGQLLNFSRSPSAHLARARIFLRHRSVNHALHDDALAKQATNALGRLIECLELVGIEFRLEHIE